MFIGTDSLICTQLLLLSQYRAVTIKCGTHGREAPGRRSPVGGRWTVVGGRCSHNAELMAEDFAVMMRPFVSLLEDRVRGL